MCLGSALLAGAVFPQQKCYEPANVFGSAFRARALKLKRITDNVLTYCSTEHVKNVMYKPALSTIHPGLDFQTLSISIDRSTLVLEKLTNLESWRLWEAGWLQG